MRLEILDWWSVNIRGLKGAPYSWPIVDHLWACSFFLLVLPIWLLLLLRALP